MIERIKYFSVEGILTTFEQRFSAIVEKRDTRGEMGVGDH